MPDMPIKKASSMSEYAIRALDASTWDAFARLAEKHKGGGFGCGCTWFHSREGRPEGEVGNTTRSLYEQTGFSYDRPKGKNHCVMRRTVSAAKKPRRARVG